MSKLKLHLIGFLSLAIAGIITFFVLINDGGNWAFAPGLVWFVVVQIFLVPKILKKKD